MEERRANYLERSCHKAGGSVTFHWSSLPALRTLVTKPSENMNRYTLQPNLSLPNQTLYYYYCIFSKINAKSLCDVSLPRYWLQDQDNRIRRQEDQATNMVRQFCFWWQSCFLWCAFTFPLVAAEGFRWLEMDDKIAVFQLPSNSSTGVTYILCDGDMGVFHDWLCPLCVPLC